jgi:serine/threonine protein kinase
MAVRRQPSTPPTIPGFEYVCLLGMGGFADVFKYRQEFPRRSVAVKVLLSGSLDRAARDAFIAEANVMAQLSHHPSIVTVYHADIAPEGTPYLIMEYCARPSLGTRYRAERFTVEEVLRTGIRVASAVEAAHHLGILHRDIKPANILATDFGWPALTDFGIAATLESTSATSGMSIPWAAPELLADVPRGDARGDVYSLGATVYSLLAGRSPFEIPGRSNGSADLVSRIERSQLPPIERADVSTNLQSVLSKAMAKKPASRFHSALAFAHALQQVERSMHLHVTSIDLSQDALPAVEPTTRDETFQPDGNGQATRLRPIVSIDPAGNASPRDARPLTPMVQPAARGPAVPPVPPPPSDDDATRMRPITTINAQVSSAVRPHGHDHVATAHPGVASTQDSTVAQPGGARPVGTTAAPTPLAQGSLTHADVAEYTVARPLHAMGQSEPQAESLRERPATSRAQAHKKPLRHSTGETFAPTPDERLPQHYRSTADEPDEESTSRSPRRRLLIAVAVVVVVAGLAVVTYLALAGDAQPNPLESTAAPAPTVATEASVPSPARLAGVDMGDGTISFTWTNPNPLVGDAYTWREIGVGQQNDLELTDRTSVLVPLPDDADSVCIEVSIVRANGQSSTTPAEACSQ